MASLAPAASSSLLPTFLRYSSTALRAVQRGTHTTAAASSDPAVIAAMDAAARARAKAAVLGALVADAGTMPLHWIYDADKVRGLLEGRGRLQSPEFFPEPSCPFYTYPVGALSPYGDEALATLQYAAGQPEVDGPGFAQHLVTFFKAYTGRLNHTAKHLVEQWEAGEKYPAAAADDSQANAIVKVPVLVARYGGTPSLASRVEEAVRAQQNSDEAVAWGVAAAAILERVVLTGCSAADAVAWALAPGSLAPASREALAPLEAQERPSVTDMVWQVTKAPSCAMPGAIVNALYCAQVSQSYVAAVRSNLAAAGDNCSRALYAGALLAAAEGEGAVPEGWKEQLTPGLYAQLEALVDQLLDRRSD